MPPELLAGIDEAGKGPVLGSMFIAGLATDAKGVEALKRLGVRDSKLLTPARREELAAKIEPLGKVHVVELSAARIDELRKRTTVNIILVEAYAEVLRFLKPGKAWLDAPDVKPERFAERVGAACGLKPPPEIVAEHGADATYPIVSAASIVAKVRRDRSVRALEARLGFPIGSGYPSDPATVAALPRVLKEAPGEVRHSWETVGRLKNAPLSDFASGGRR
jgi:ribonuclease HII